MRAAVAASLLLGTSLGFLLRGWLLGERAPCAQPTAQHHVPNALLAASQRDHDDGDGEDGSAPFVPVVLKGELPCDGLKPCLHSSSASRRRQRCQRTVWQGEWALTPADNQTVLRKTPEQQQWAPSADCDLADVWTMAPDAVKGKRHVTVARRQHTHLRLKPVRDSLWLMIGTSLEENLLRYACAGFGEEPRLVEGFGSGLNKLVTWCRLPSLNLSLVAVQHMGLTAREYQSNPAGWTLRLGNVSATLGREGWADGPTYVTLAGIEWDFKLWDQVNVPPSERTFRYARRTIEWQIDAMRKRWPGVRAFLLRTMYMSTYAGFNLHDMLGGKGDRLQQRKHRQKLQAQQRDPNGPASSFGAAEPVVAGDATDHATDDATEACYRERPRHACMVESNYRRYSALMRELAVQSEGRSCARVVALDLEQLAHCSVLHTMTCSHKSGWTKDGLHPVEWLNRVLLNLCLNVMADETACQQPPESR